MPSRLLHHRGAIFAAILLAASAGASAQSAPLAPREVPAKTIPVPNTVSPELQQIIAQPLRSGWNTPPTTEEGWKQLAESIRVGALPNVEAMRERLKVRVEPGTIAGVKIYTVTPEKILPENRDRVLVQIHGGCYVLNPAEAALPEAMLISAIGGYRVIAVDYRMPPEAYFPAALDDSMAVYKEVIAKTDPKRVGLIGTDPVPRRFEVGFLSRFEARRSAQRSGGSAQSGLACAPPPRQRSLPGDLPGLSSRRSGGGHD